MCECGVVDVCICVDVCVLACVRVGTRACLSLSHLNALIVEHIPVLPAVVQKLLPKEEKLAITQDALPCYYLLFW